MSTTLLFAALISCNAAVWNPFSSLKVPLRPPIAPLVPPSLRDGGLHKPHKIALSWRESSPLGCPYGADVSLPLCGSVYELTCVADEKTSGSPRDPYIVGNIILCDTSSIKVAALWNPEVETEGFPKFQDSREDDPREYDRLCRCLVLPGCDCPHPPGVLVHKHCVGEGEAVFQVLMHVCEFI